jgi:ABC-type bacteriocin/lantibiotic exporter with double-glycine peptidase domain
MGSALVCAFVSLGNATHAMCEELLSNPYIVSETRSCGPRCLAFVHRLLGGQLSYSQVAAHCQPGPDGTSLAAILAAARRIGMRAAPFCSPLESVKAYGRPCIIHLHRPDRGHFVAVTSWDAAQQAFEVYDPPAGVSLMSASELGHKYAGVGVLLAGPDSGEDLERVLDDESWRRVRAIAFAAIAFSIGALLCFAPWRVLVRGRPSARP